jgi:hypothetical protein
MKHLSHDTLALALPSLPPIFSIERGPLLSLDVLIPLNTATFVVCVQCRETSFLLYSSNTALIWDLRQPRTLKKDDCEAIRLYPITLPRTLLCSQLISLSSTMYFELEPLKVKIGARP